MVKSKSFMTISSTLAEKFPGLSAILEEEKLRKFGIREFEIYAIYNILNKDLLATAIVLFLGFSHGDSYPITSIAEALRYSDMQQILKVLQRLRTKGIAYIQKIGVNFYFLDRDFLLFAINNFKLKKISLSSLYKERVSSLYDSLRLHPRIRKASESLFKTGHYAQAIFEAFKCLEVLVKEKSGVNDLDGQTLMASVFNEAQPVIKLNKLQSTSDKDEQIGFKFIFMGAMTGIRNPKAHEMIKQKEPYKTLEYLSLASVLAKRVEEGSL